jgi:hypothetical protein
LQIGSLHLTNDVVAVTVCDGVGGVVLGGVIVGGGDALATAVDVSTGVSSSAAAVHWQPRWTSP